MIDRKQMHEYMGDCARHSRRETGFNVHTWGKGRKMTMKRDSLEISSNDTS